MVIYLTVTNTHCSGIEVARENSSPARAQYNTFTRYAQGIGQRRERMVRFTLTG